MADSKVIAVLGVGPALGAEALALRVDATDPASVATAFAKVRESLGAIDVLVYNAGAFVIGGILEVEPSVFEQCWKANCMGGFLGARAVLPAMQERGAGTVIVTGATRSPPSDVKQNQPASNR